MTDGQTQGPLLAAAFFCDRVIDEKDEVKSIIRIIDTFTPNLLSVHGLTSDGSISIIEEPMILPLQPLMYVKFVSGRFRGTKTIQVRIQDSAATEKILKIVPEPIEFEVSFRDNPVAGVNILHRWSLEVQDFGVLMFDVLVDSDWITSIPLRINEPPAEDLQQHSLEAAQ